MARIRSVKPDFFTSYSNAQLCIEARLLLIGLMTEADDYGILIDSSKRIAGAVFPHDDGVTPELVEGWLNDIAKLGTIHRYEVEGGRYIEFPKWEIHQRVSHKGGGRLPRSSGELPEIGQTGTGEDPATLGPDLGKGTGNREQGSAQRGEPSDFVEFYSAYPRKVARKDALKAWSTTAKSVDPRIIIDGAKRFANDPNLPEPKFIPYPATWLRAGRWEDGPLPGPTKPGTEWIVPDTPTW